MFALRFDMRAPQGNTAELYAAALEMSTYAESHGCLSALVCEHHGIDDGYLPSPLTMATAMAARTTTLPITVAVILLPLYDPIRLAEDMAVLDLISKGRVSYVGGVGARKVEYDMLGGDYGHRGRTADEKLAILLKAKTGEPFEVDGRTVQVTPAPFTPGGPMIMWGGGSPAAARRAGRNGIGFFGQSDDTELGKIYSETARAAGHEPGFCYLPGRNDPFTIFVAEDVDKAWEELGDYMMHDVHMYASWYAEHADISSTSFAATAEDLRAEKASHRIFGVEEAIEWVRGGRHLALHPLIGGMPPELAWKYLHVVTEQVVPAVRG